MRTAPGPPPKRAPSSGRGATLDKLKSLSPDDKKRMQGYIVFRADGTGAYLTGGMRKASRLNAALRPQSIPIKWGLEQNVIRFSPGGKDFFPYTPSPDGRTLTDTRGNRIRYVRNAGPPPTR